MEKEIYENRNILIAKNNKELLKIILEDKLNIDLDINELIDDVGKLREMFKLQDGEDNEVIDNILEEVYFIKRLPLEVYKDIKRTLISIDNKINDKLNLVNNKRESNENKLKEIDNEISKLNSEISKKKRNFEDFSEELNKKENIISNLHPHICAIYSKCDWYEKMINNEKERIDTVWTEEYIMKQAIKYSMREYNNNYGISKIIDSEIIFDVDVDYSITIKIMPELEVIADKYINGIYHKSNESELELEKFNEIIRNLENLKINNKNEYVCKLEEYISGNNILGKIQEHIENNYIIESRREIVEEILDLYKRKKWQTFINLVVTQLEGILYDYCIEVDLMPDKLSGFTMGTKLNRLHEQNLFKFYDYFKFYIEVLRNKVAHGLVISDESELLSKELILDLSGLLYQISNNIKIPIVNLKRLLSNYKGYKCSNNRYMNDIKLRYKCIFNFITNSNYLSLHYDNEISIEDRLNLLFNPIFEKKVGNLTYELYEVREIMLSKEFWMYIKEHIEESTLFGKYETGESKEINKFLLLFYRIISKYNKSELIEIITNLKNIISNK